MARILEAAPSITPSDNLKGEPEVIDKIIRDGKVDADALSALEQQGNAPVTAAAYFIAGKHEMEQTNYNRARNYFETAMRFEGQNPTILNYYVALLLRPEMQSKLCPTPNAPYESPRIRRTRWPSWATRNMPVIGIKMRSAVGNGRCRFVLTRRCKNIWRRPSAMQARNPTSRKTKAATSH